MESLMSCPNMDIRENINENCTFLSIEIHNFLILGISSITDVVSR